MTRQNEIGFCAKIKAWAEELFRDTYELPFARAEIEESIIGGRKRYDLRFYTRKDDLCLCGEVKLPGTIQGQSPYNSQLVWDAYQKADAANCRYFFTWNVNTFVLFDRQRWDVPMIQRRVREWPLNLRLSEPQQAFLPEVASVIRENFLPTFLHDFAQILDGRAPEWGMPPDDIFIKALESHLEWPVILVRDWLASEADRRPSFGDRLADWMAKDQDWSFLRSDPEEWRRILHRAASTLCYVLANRLIFYSAVRARFPELPDLQIPRRIRDSAEAYRFLQGRFTKAVEASGDYEPVFYPHETEQDWLGPLVFKPDAAIPAWNTLLSSIGQFDFRAIPHDIVGKIFQRLIGPEERHKFGQFFTSEEIVDLVNAFCIRKADAKVLDPACGSGSFLVRAYHRKGYLQPTLSHAARLEHIYGCDISLFAAHLATLNLAARQIQEEQNYPQIARRNFFEVEPGQPFCQVPGRARNGRLIERSVSLPALDAVVGNPPYLREGLISHRGQRGAIETQTKEYLRELVNRAWPDLTMDGRSDLHCYFWPAATRLLRPDGYFGFITSSNWLDAGYGFAFQGWLLRHFRIVAVIEPADEPWFEDARVRTCATILQRCDVESARLSNTVRFVRLKRHLSALLGERPDEASRQKAAEGLRDLIENQRASLLNDPNLRIICKMQRNLWEEGLAIGEVLRRHEDNETESDQDDEDGDESTGGREEPFHIQAGQYGGGKWGRYLRAPDCYFYIMQHFGSQFVRLGEIVDIRYGVKTGCDKFFMPKNITEKALANCPDDRMFQRRYGCKRSDVERGRLVLAEAGDKTTHPLEKQYVEPVIHNLRMVRTARLTSVNTSRLVLLVKEDLRGLRAPWVGRYLKYGETTTFASKKSKAVPVPERETCAARDPWYDLTQTGRGFAFWPKATQYGHIVVANVDKLICNCRVYYIQPLEGINDIDTEALTALLNSTLVALWKQFYGRPTGVEGSYDVMVADAKIMEVPDPRAATSGVRARLKAAWRSLSSREFGYFLEDELLECRSKERARAFAARPIGLPVELQQKDRRELDDAVLELIGVSDAGERTILRERLYEETTRYFRQVRLVEIEKMEQRARGGGERLTPTDLANDLFDASEESRPSLIDWLASLSPSRAFIIPEGRPSLPAANDMYDSTTVFFATKGSTARVDCPNRAIAELVERLAQLGIRGKVMVPDSEEAARWTLERVELQIMQASQRFQQVAEGRTGDIKLQREVVDLLMRWFVMGKDT
jgi:methylase of polypeptide subunit release factors